MKTALLLFLISALSGCFMIPRWKINRALKTKNCRALSSKWIYDLSTRQIKKSFEICLEKKLYEESMDVLFFLEMKDLPFEQKIWIWRQKGRLYAENLFLYDQAAKEFEKILKKRPKDFRARKNLIQTRIKNKDFNTALKEVKGFVLDSKDNKNKLKFQWLEARLLLLLKLRPAALKVFYDIQQTAPVFFKKNQGPFYLALLLEEEQKFLSAVKELRSAKWKFFDEKKEHWMNRFKNTPGEKK